MSDDPFDDLDPDEYEDREGDPFESLDVDADGEADGAADPTPGVPARDDEESANGASETPDADRESGGADVDRESAGTDADLAGADADLAGADAVDPRDRKDATPGDVDVAGDPFGDVDVSRGDPFEAGDSAFEQVDVDAADPDAVWTRLTEKPEADREAAAAATAAAPDAEDDVVVVSKHRFCEGCPHFTAPPDVECTHPGTEIIEFVGPDDVRISNCPIVRERRELGEVHE